MLSVFSMSTDVCPFTLWTFEDGHLQPVRDSTEHTGDFPPFLVVQLNLEFESGDGPASEFNPIRSLSIKTVARTGYGAPRSTY